MKVKIVILSILFIVLSGVFAGIFNVGFRHEEPLVYVTKTGECYHSIGCSYLKSVIPIGKNKAIKEGYRLCSRCNGIENGTIVVNNWLVSIPLGILSVSAIYIIVVYVKSKLKDKR